MKLEFGNYDYGVRLTMDYEKVLSIIKEKIDRRMENNLPDSRYYEFCNADDNGNYKSEFLDLYDGCGWTRSFLTGIVAYLYFHYKDEKYLDYLNKQKEVYDTYLYAKLSDISHDVGFLYSLYSGALYELTGDKEAFRMNLRAADELSKRFIPKPGIINGFGDPEGEVICPIIDDLMNISLLMWAWRKTEHPYYKRLFTSHLKTVKKYMIRDNFTVRHSYLFEENTGEPLGERNFCGFSVGSVWARGQMWALYGLINVMKTTEDYTLYGHTINGLLNRLISFLDDEIVPIWDFDCMGEKNIMRDSSAGAIMAAALFKLKGMEEENEEAKKEITGVAENYKDVADKMLDKLLEDYLVEDTSCDMILDKGQSGSNNCGVVWGDYFVVEAIMRKIHGKDCPDFWVGNK